MSIMLAAASTLLVVLGTVLSAKLLGWYRMNWTAVPAPGICI